MFSMKKRFTAKRTEDGRCFLNLACGNRTHPAWTNIDFSPYTRLAHHLWLSKFLKVSRFISQHRYQTLLKIDPEIIAWDLRKGIPFENETFNVVYTSHFVEHIERDAVANFITECSRVLKLNGIIRIVVPDLLLIVNRYITSARLLENRDNGAMQAHEKAIMDMFAQMVRMKAVGTSQQSWFLREIERLFRGDARKQGDLHRWMYDKYTLTTLLSNCGFQQVKAVTAQDSKIEGWTKFNLDTDEDGRTYKPKSLYVEGVKV